jgi:solute carrier family 25 carnitine/acylcarnitine transporter 20/29
MQAQPGYEKFTMLQTAKSIVKNDGIKGLYRGCVPPLWVSF